VTTSPASPTRRQPPCPFPSKVVLQRAAGDRIDQQITTGFTCRCPAAVPAAGKQHVPEKVLVRLISLLAVTSD
jgi:hypothetical protein